MFNQLLKSSTLGILAKLIQGIGSFLLIRILILKLGQEEYGIWMTISSSISLISFLDFGIGNNLMNKLAEYNALGDKKNIIKATSLSFFILTFLIFIIILLFLILYKFINWNYIFNLDNNKYDFLIFITFLLFILNILTNSIYSIQRGLQKSDIANKWLLINSILFITIVISVLSYSTNLLYTAYISFGLPIIVSIINLYLFVKKYKLIDFKYFNFKYLKESTLLLKNGLVFLYLQIASIIAFQADTLILAHYSNFSSVSQYNVVAKIFSIPTIFIGVYYQTLWPTYTHYKTINNWNWIKKTYYKSIMISSILIIIYSVIILIFKNEILFYWLKNRIDIPASLFILYSIWTIINLSIATNIGTLLNSLNIVKIQIICSIFMLMVNIFLSIYCTEIYGAIGVLIGSIVSSLLMSCIPLLIYIRKIFNKKIYTNGNL